VTPAEAFAKAVELGKLKQLFIGLALRFARSRALPLVFFLLTVATTLHIGSLHAIYFQGLAGGDRTFTLWQHVVFGLPFCLTIMAIIASHELGHYLTARRYRVSTSLPVFIPFPFSIIGTLGAFILIRSPFPNRRALIDIGLAGPFAGFVVCIPALIFGIATSRASAGAVPAGSFGLGEPVLLQAVAHWFWSDLPEQNITLSPIGLAAWFGLLLTAINLLPIGQLDGGHATYALFRERAHRLSAIAFFALLPLSLLAPSWLFFALFTYLLGIRRPHPPTVHDDTPLSAGRKAMGVLGLVTFALCFTPEPIQIDWSDLFALFR
jgi:membrane-associated protease RseP (regulator of RpoE activity)